MRIPRSCRLAALGLTAPLFFLGSALAQDGKQPVGPPTTTPPTNKLRDNADTFEAPTVGGEVLAPVPATASDPAPPGTRVERVDLNRGPRRPGPAKGLAVPADVPGVNSAATLPEGMRAVEGLISGDLQRPGKDLPGEQIRFTVDPSRNWADYLAKSATPSETAKDASKPIELIVTRKTKIYTYARTPVGKIVVDGSNPYAPTSDAARTAPNVRGPLYTTTNFTNLKPEQYIAVQYRKAGDRFEATSVAIVVRASAQASLASEVAPTPGSTKGSNGLSNVRVPRVPATPAAPAAGP